MGRCRRCPGSGAGLFLGSPFSSRVCTARIRDGYAVLGIRSALRGSRRVLGDVVPSLGSLGRRERPFAHCAFRHRCVGSWRILVGRVHGVWSRARDGRGRLGGRFTRSGEMGREPTAVFPAALALAQAVAAIPSESRAFWTPTNRSTMPRDRSFCADSSFTHTLSKKKRSITSSEASSASRAMRWRV